MSRLTDRDLDAIRQCVCDDATSSAAAFITDAHELQALNTDWMHRYIGTSPLCVRPQRTEQVAALLAYCQQRRLAVTPQGGNTGLVGGSVPVHDEIILSTSRMNRVLHWEPQTGTVTVEAGAVLQAVNAYCGQHGYRFPLDLGAKGSCQIGGNVATNASGSRFLRYGSLRGRVTGMEVVLADGTVLDLGLGRALRKDNTGYDLKQWFIGSEGTLGVVTKVSVACAPAPAAVHTALLGLRRDFNAVLALSRRAQHQLGEILYALEFMDREAVTLLERQQSGASVGNPLAHQPDCGFYVLLETGGGVAEHDRARLESFLEQVVDDGLVLDGVLAQDQSQSEALWRMREGLSEAVSRAGPMTFKYDLSLPPSAYYQVVEQTRQRLQLTDDAVQVVSWGHLGDGNVHLNVVAPTRDRQLQAALEPWVYAWVARHGGSVSAEHGIGRMKASCVQYSQSAAAIEKMRALKRMLDPYGILNPYKLFDA